MHKLSILFLTMLFTATSVAQWSTNPAVNSMVSTGNSGAALPYVATHGCGTSYISWFTPSGNGEYMPWITRLDVNGNSMFLPVQVSAHPSMTWITDYSLAVTPDTSALVAFQDMRTGNNDIFIYKMGQAGEFLWGSDGIQLSSDPGFEANPVMAVHADGSVVAAWPLEPLSGKNKIILQRLNAAGQKQWGNGIILENTSYEFTWPCLVAVDNGFSILVWYKESGPYWAPNRIMVAQKFDTFGSAVWPSEAVLFTGAMPVYVHPVVASDGQGGVYVTWMHEPTASRLSSKIQHVNATGIVTMPVNGVELNTNPSNMSLEPSLGVDVNDHSAYVFWRESNMLQTVFGIGGQRVDMSGNKKWGAYGKTFAPLGTTFASIMNVTGLNGSVILSYIDDDSGTATLDQVVARKVDSTGNEPWNGATRFIASTSSHHGHLVSSPLNCGQVIYAWEDDKNGEQLIYAQNLREDGTYGPVDDSFILTPDTLWFITDDDFVEGKTFYIHNPHGYSIDLQHIDISGQPCPNCIPWYTTPAYTSFPLTLGPGDSLATLVRFYALDGSGMTFTYDTLNVNTIGQESHVIIAADSMKIIIGLPENGPVGLTAAPNPFTERITIRCAGDPMNEATVTIRNNLMQPVRLLYKGKMNGTPLKLTWDGTNNNGIRVGSGVYFITLTTPVGVKTLKVIKV